MTTGSALAWLDGQTMPLAEAKVSAEDRGYLFADGVYEVIRAYGGRLFAAVDHLERLKRSADGIKLALPHDLATYGAVAKRLLAEAKLDDAEIYIQVSRGVARRHHLFPADVPPVVLMWVQGLRPTDPALKATGVKAITLPDERWARCNLKTISLLPNVLAKEEARQRGAFEAFLVRDGLVTEGTSCNAFFVKGGTLVTAKADNRILNGITRVHLLDLAKGLGIAVEERDIPVAELAGMDEAFVTSTLMEVMPVASIDGKDLGDGKPGPVTRQLADALSAHIAAG